MAELILTPEKIREIMLEADVTNKSHIARLLKDKYSVENWVYPTADVLKDLIFCWLVKQYFIGAHEAIVSYAEDGAEKDSKLSTLKTLYQDAHSVQLKIDASLDMGDFSTAVSALDFYNPTKP